MYKDYLRLNYNENCYVNQYFSRFLEDSVDITNYPSIEFEEFRNRIAGMYRIEKDNIYLGNGIDELILSIVILFCDEGDEIIIPEKTYKGYENSANLLKRAVVLAKLENYKVSVKNIIARITEKTKIIFICNPHNPTGSVISKKEIMQLIYVCEKNNILFVLDEAYYEFCGDVENWYQYSSSLKNFIVLRTFSKFYGAAGLRIGYAISNKQVIKKMREIKKALPFNVNVMAQKYSLKILDIINENKNDILFFYNNVRKRFYESLEKLHLFYVNSNTNFVLVKIEMDADEFCAIMKEQYHILIKSGSEWGLNNFVRISLCNNKDSDYLFFCIKEVFEKKDKKICDMEIEKFCKRKE